MQRVICSLGLLLALWRCPAVLGGEQRAARIPRVTFTDGRTFIGRYADYLTWSDWSSRSFNYTPRDDYVGYLEMQVDDHVILQPRLDQIESVERKAGHSGSTHEVLLVSGQRFVGKLLGEGWKGETVVEGFAAEVKIPQDHVLSVQVKRTDKNGVIATIRSKDGKETSLSNPEYKVTAMKPGLSLWLYSHTYLPLKVRPGTEIKIPRERIDSIVVRAGRGGKRKCSLSIRLDDGKTMTGPANYGFILEGKFQDVDATVLVSKTELSIVKCIEFVEKP